MTPQQLLKELETLTHANRMRRMFDLGRQSINNPTLHASLQTLSQGDVYQRALATQSCAGSRDSTLLLRSLQDPSRSVRSIALALIPSICTDTHIISALDTITTDFKKALLNRLFRKHHQAPIDAYITTLAQRQDPDLHTFFSFASPALIQHYLPQLIDKFTLVDWQRLTRHHPLVALTHLQARIPTASTDQHFLSQLRVILPLLTESHSDLALQLVQTLATSIPLDKLPLQDLAQKHPAEIIDLIQQSNERCTVHFKPNTLRRLDTAHLITLFTQYPNSVSTNALPKLTPAQRSAIYAACELRWRDSEGILSPDIIAYLPTPQRVAEAQRHLQLPILTTRTLNHLKYVTFLPWDEALSTIQPTLNSPDADLRSASLNALISSIRYQRSHLPDALQLILRRRYEQDPVRLSMLSALSSLPRTIWQPAHLSDFTQIILDTLNAKDLSSATSNAIEKLIIHLIPSHPTWAALQLANIYRANGRVGVYNLERELSDNDVRLIAPALVPVLKSWQNIEKEGQLLALARALGKRFTVFTELADLLSDRLDHSRYSSTVSYILTLFKKYVPARLHTAIPHLLSKDKSCITLEPVSTYIHLHRQDLLNPYLGQYAYKGRFSSGKTRVVLPVSNGFFRWTPTQQDTFAKTLLEIARDDKRATHEVFSALYTLTNMPAINPAYLIQFARDSRQPVREVALNALGKLDAGQGIPTLIEALSDERARTAIYVLRSALFEMPKSEALTILRAVPFTQVTVAKEVVRLIGDLSYDEAFQELLHINTRDLHRDVRIALLRALWPYTDYPESWAIFTQAATSSDISLAKGVIYIPIDGMSTQARTNLTNLIATLLTHPDPTVRLDTLQRCTNYPISDPYNTLYPTILNLLNSPLTDECTSAAKSIFSLYSSEEDNTQIHTLIQSLLPNRRSLNTAISTYLSTLYYNHQRRLNTTRTLISTLASDPLTLSLRIQLIITGLPWSEVAPALIQLAPSIHAHALQTATISLNQVANRPNTDLQSFEQALSTNSDPTLRSLAFSAFLAQTRADGWTNSHRARLTTYQQDPSPLISELAQFTFSS